MMMSYCNLYKMKCCEDIKEEMKQMEIVDSQVRSYKLQLAAIDSNGN